MVWECTTSSPRRMFSYVNHLNWICIFYKEPVSTRHRVAVMDGTVKLIIFTTIITIVKVCTLMFYIYIWEWRWNGECSISSFFKLKYVANYTKTDKCSWGISWKLLNIFSAGMKQCQFYNQFHLNRSKIMMAQRQRYEELIKVIFQAPPPGTFFWKPRLGLDLSIPTTRMYRVIIKNNPLSFREFTKNRTLNGTPTPNNHTKKS